MSNILYRDLRKRLPIIDRGEGIYLYDSAGNRYLDAASGAVVVNIGYGRRRVIEAMIRQAQKLPFAHGSKFTSQPAEELAHELARLAPGDLSQVFFVSGGSEAVESAFKLAWQYHVERGDRGRYKIVSLRPSYHGSTLAALSASYREELQEPYRSILIDFPKISAPYPGQDPDAAWELEKLIQEQGEESIAALIIEPIGGASSGALVPSQEYLRMIRQICDQHDVLLIADEVMVGFGRTGKFFAIEHYDVIPDILIGGKGLGSGYCPLGAVIAREAIVERLRTGSGRFFHGFTYQGNPLACAVGLEVVKIIQEEKLVDNAQVMGEYLLERLREFSKGYELITDVRGKGLLLALEFGRDISHKRRPLSLVLTEQAFQQGLILYPRSSIAHDHLLIAPPLSINRDEIDLIVELLETSITALDWR
ncbi:MAG: aspartate aminotransferase family protein [Candidatus Bipolaricaulia bacterium]